MSKKYIGTRKVFSEESFDDILAAKHQNSPDLILIDVSLTEDQWDSVIDLIKKDAESKDERKFLTFSCSHTEIIEDKFPALVDALKNHPTINDISFGDNGNLNYRLLFEELLPAKRDSIKSFGIEFNNIGDEGLRVLSDVLSNSEFSDIEALSLRGNQISGDSLLRLAGALGRSCPKINAVDLAANPEIGSQHLEDFLLKLPKVVDVGTINYIEQKDNEVFKRAIGRNKDSKLYATSGSVETKSSSQLQGSKDLSR